MKFILLFWNFGHKCGYLIWKYGHMTICRDGVFDEFAPANSEKWELFVEKWSGFCEIFSEIF